MNRLLLISTLFLLITGLVAGSGVSEVASNHGDDTSTVAIGSQHDESGSEAVAEIAVKGGTISNTIIAGIIEKNQVKRGTVVALIATERHLDDRKQVNILVNDEENPGWQSVTIPGKSIEQDSYREGNEASHEKKIQGQPSFDDLEMERGVKPGATELHDWIKDIQAGKADSARKEIAVKIQNEEGGAREGGKTVGAGQVTEILDLVHSDKNQIGNEVSAISKRSARKGRNPQTGKEIKIPAKKVINFKPGAELSEKIKTIKDNESGEEYPIRAIMLTNDIQDNEDILFELREGRKGMNAVDVRRVD